MTTLGKTIKAIRKSKNMTQKELSYLTGFKQNTISNHENGNRSLTELDIDTYAQALNVSPQYLFAHRENTAIDSTILTIYTQLEKVRQHRVYQFAKDQLDEQHTPKEVPTNICELFPVHVIEALAAGTGYSYGDNNTELFYTDRDDLKAYDFASLVTGDSMEPFYFDGDIVLIKRGYDNNPGAVYAIDYDGKSYLKKLFDAPDHLRLVSINSKYEDIIIPKPFDAYFNVIGRVVDSFTPVKK